MWHVGAEQSTWSTPEPGAGLARESRMWKCVSGISVSSCFSSLKHNSGRNLHFVVRSRHIKMFPI